jgi:CRP/FNR family transcriptional regulator, cyclic AMP receptor protein
MNAKPVMAIPPEPKNGMPAGRSLEEAVRKHPFLAGLNVHQYRLLSDCAMACRFEAGAPIFRAGDPANRFYLIQKGKVGLYAPTADRGLVCLQVLKDGDVLGWSWLFPPFYWHFDAQAIEPTDAIFIYATPLRAECECDHELGYELFKRMAEVMLKRLQATRRQLMKLPAGGLS